MAFPGGASACLSTRTPPAAAYRRFLPLLAAVLLLGCLHGDPDPEAGPPPVKTGRFIYRGGLDGRAGLLFYAADTARMTLVYDTARCSLYEAWRGPVAGGLRNPDGSYAAQGPLYHRQNMDTLWRIGNGGDTVAAAPRFLGFEEDSAGGLTLHYAIEWPWMGTILIDEVPSYFDHYGDVVLRRDFYVHGLEPGTDVLIRLGGASFAWPELWSQSADGMLTGGPGGQILGFANDGVADVRVTFEGSAF